MDSCGRPFIPLARPTLGAEEERAVAEVLRSGWVSQGPRVAEFERRLAEFLGCRFVRAVNSGTSALTLALKALGIGPGDSVVVPAFTCAATALPVLALGAEAVFADVDPSTLNVAWAGVEAALRRNTKAVVLVHLFGRMADAAGLAARCRERGIHLVEDACLALGAKQAGRAAGTIGVAGCHSFHPRKIITTGEGGAVCTDDEALAQSVESDRNYGAASSSWARFQKGEGSLRGFERLAFNFKLTDLQAAVGIVQMGRLPGFLAERRRLVAIYRSALADIPGIVVPAPAEPEEDACQAMVCLWAPARQLVVRPSGRKDTGLSPHYEQELGAAVASREAIRAGLVARAIAFSDAAQFLPELPVFGGSGPGDDGPQAGQWPVAFLAARLAFALPLFPGMTPEVVERVCQAVREAARGAAP